MNMDAWILKIAKGDREAQSRKVIGLLAVTILLCGVATLGVFLLKIPLTISVTSVNTQPLTVTVPIEFAPLIQVSRPYRFTANDRAYGPLLPQAYYFDNEQKRWLLQFAESLDIVGDLKLQLARPTLYKLLFAKKNQVL